MQLSSLCYKIVLSAVVIRRNEDNAGFLVLDLRRLGRPSNMHCTSHCCSVSRALCMNCKWTYLGHALQFAALLASFQTTSGANLAALLAELKTVSGGFKSICCCAMTAVW